MTNDSPARELLTAYLADSDARCPACRYALRGCASDKCPECGYELALAIASPHTISGWWLAGVIGLSLSAAMAFCVLFGLGAWIVYDLQHPGLRAQARAGFASMSDLPRWTPIIAVTVLMVAITLVLACLGSRRGGFGRLPRTRRAWLGLLAATSPLMTLGAIALIAAMQ